MYVLSALITHSQFISVQIFVLGHQHASAKCCWALTVCESHLIPWRSHRAGFTRGCHVVTPRHCWVLSAALLPGTGLWGLSVPALKSAVGGALVPSVGNGCRAQGLGRSRCAHCCQDVCRTSLWTRLGRVGGPAPGRAPPTALPPLTVLASCQGVR